MLLYWISTSVRQLGENWHLLLRRLSVPVSDWQLAVLQEPSSPRWCLAYSLGVTLCPLVPPGWWIAADWRQSHRRSCKSLQMCFIGAQAASGQISLCLLQLQLQLPALWFCLVTEDELLFCHSPTGPWPQLWDVLSKAAALLGAETLFSAREGKMMKSMWHGTLVCQPSVKYLRGVFLKTWCSEIQKFWNGIIFTKLYWFLTLLSLKK